jgi:hypothetical protein
MPHHTVSRQALVATILLGSAWWASNAFAATDGAGLIAHRAVYDLSLLKASDGSSAPAAARGRIVYEFTGSPCEGWVTNFRQMTELQMNEGGERVSDMRSSTFEEGDGSAFQFKTDTFINNKQVDAVDGNARKASDGGLAISLSKPKPSKTDLDAGAVFPTAQILRIMDAAKAGEKTAEIKIFDGSDSGSKVFDTMAIIGHRKDADAVELASLKADVL